VGGYADDAGETAMNALAEVARVLSRALGCRLRAEVGHIEPRFILDIAEDDMGAYVHLVVGHDDEVAVSVRQACPIRRSALLEIRCRTVRRDPCLGCWLPDEDCHQVLLLAGASGWDLRFLPTGFPVATVSAARAVLDLECRGLFTAAEIRLLASRN